MTEEEPTPEQLRQAWRESQERQKQKQQSQHTEENLPKSASEGRLRDQEGKLIDYDTAKNIWNAKRGLNPNSHTDAPLTPEQKQNEARYQHLRTEWYARQGKVDPKIRKANIQIFNTEINNMQIIGDNNGSFCKRLPSLDSCRKYCHQCVTTIRYSSKISKFQSTG